MKIMTTGPVRKRRKIASETSSLRKLRSMTRSTKKMNGKMELESWELWATKWKNSGKLLVKLKTDVVELFGSKNTNL